MHASRVHPSTPGRRTRPNVFSHNASDLGWRGVGMYTVASAADTSIGLSLSVGRSWTMLAKLVERKVCSGGRKVGELRIPARSSAVSDTPRSSVVTATAEIAGCRMVCKMHLQLLFLLLVLSCSTRPCPRGTARATPARRAPQTRARRGSWLARGRDSQARSDVSQSTQPQAHLVPVVNTVLDQVDRLVDRGLALGRDVGLWCLS